MRGSHPKRLRTAEGLVGLESNTTWELHSWSKHYAEAQNPFRVLRDPERTPGKYKNRDNVYEGNLNGMFGGVNSGRADAGPIHNHCVKRRFMEPYHRQHYLIPPVPLVPQWNNEHKIPQLNDEHKIPQLNNEQKKKDKFAIYPHHLPPEDDPLASRTVYAGNLEPTITHAKLAEIFGEYGTIEDIDIKKELYASQNETGFPYAYAFIRFVNVELAYKAKSELYRRCIGEKELQVEMGYAYIVEPTFKVWVGGLGDWTTYSQLKHAFKKFGHIKKIEWIRGVHCAYITFDSISAAADAVSEMRGYPLGGRDKRIRTDFADAKSPPIGSHLHDHPKNSGGNRRAGGRGMGSEFYWESKDGSMPDNADRSAGNDGDDDTAPRSEPEYERGYSQQDSECGIRNGDIKSIHDICQKAGIAWYGGFVLRNSAFWLSLYLTEGDIETIELLIKSEEQQNQLKITQRLMLSQNQFDQKSPNSFIKKCIRSASHYSVCLALPTSYGSHQQYSQTTCNNLQPRPVSDLISDMYEKGAAYLISLSVPSDPSITGLLYILPPSLFSLELLRRRFPGINSGVDVNGRDIENYLVVVIARWGHSD